MWISQRSFDTRMDRLESLVHQILGKENILMATMDDIVKEVAAEKTVVDSAVTLLNELKAELDAAIASGDPTKLQALSDSIGVQTAALSEAVVANTPGAPTPTPIPATSTLPPKYQG